MNKINYYQLTTIGDRAENQDYMLNKIAEDYALFVVADGLGGHQGGEMAARLFCQCFVKLADKFGGLIKQAPEKTALMWFNAAVNLMAEQFEGHPAAADAYTTCAILIITESLTISAHCGDSRIYRINQEGVVWRTKDHSIPQKLFDDGELAEHKMGTHPEQNQLTRSINIANKFAPDIQVHPAVIKGETFVLCSDGFWEFTKEHEFSTLAEDNIEKVDLLRQAKMARFRANGRSDNITVQWVRIDEKEA